jgi:putative FmdB family regulatory protein
VPLYEYQCNQCHSLTERILKFSDPPLTVCPHCGGELEQLISAPAVQFKGSGWYVTDYSRKGGKSEPGASGNGSSGSSSDSGKAGSESSKSEPAKADTSKSDAAPSKDAK